MAQLDWLLVQALGCGREDGSGRQEIQTCSERRAGGGAENEPEVSSSPPARELESSRWLEVPSGAVDTPSPPHTQSCGLSERRGKLWWAGLEPWPGAAKPELPRLHSPPTSEGQEIGAWWMWRGELGVTRPATLLCSGHCTPAAASDGGVVLQHRCFSDPTVEAWW